VNLAASELEPSVADEVALYKPDQLSVAYWTRANSSPVYGIVTVWTIWLNVGEPGFTSITASASGLEKSGLSSRV
jgi:hypothetical protein